MKKNFLLMLGLALVCTFSAFSQTDNFEVITENRNLTAFHSVQVTGRFKIVLSETSSQSVSVTVPDKFLETVETSVSNGVLNIRMVDLSKEKGANILESLKAKYNDYLIRQPIEVRIGVNDLKSIVAKGASRIETVGMLDVPSLHVDLSGATKAEMDANVSNSLNVSLSEAAKLDIQGSAADVSVTANGAASYNGQRMLAKNAKVQLNGASRAEVHATENFDAVLNGATKVVCTGSPKTIKQQASRGSSITIQ